MKPITLTATVPAWFTSPESAYMRNALRCAIEKDDGVAVVNKLSFFAPFGGGKAPSTWVLMGEADITVRLHSRDEMVRAEVQALNAQMEAARAAFQAKQAEILERISKLQALDYVGAEA